MRYRTDTLKTITRGVGAMMNAHVEQYYRFVLWKAKKKHRHLAQWVFFTLLMHEQNPIWQA